MEASFAPYVAVDKYEEIELTLWTSGMHNIRSAACSLRNRYVLLHTTSGVLRFESLGKADLSDYMGLTLKKAEDTHPLYMMITQLPTGKCRVRFISFMCLYN